MHHFGGGYTRIQKPSTADWTFFAIIVVVLATYPADSCSDTVGVFFCYFFHQFPRCSSCVDAKHFAENAARMSISGDWPMRKSTLMLCFSNKVLI
jgi:hypothetical protein